MIDKIIDSRDFKRGKWGRGERHQLYVRSRRERFRMLIRGERESGIRVRIEVRIRVRVRFRGKDSERIRMRETRK